MHHPHLQVPAGDEAAAAHYQHAWCWVGSMKVLPDMQSIHVMIMHVHYC